MKCLSSSVFSLLALLAVPGPDVRAAAEAPVAIVGLKGVSVQPLSSLSVVATVGRTVTVRDGQGREYVRMPLPKSGAKLSFTVGGALGNQLVLIEDEGGRVVGSASFLVDAQTSILDEPKKVFVQPPVQPTLPASLGYPQGEFERMLFLFRESMGHDVEHTRYRGKDHDVFVGWIRDHVHALKGFKYFHGDVKSGVELYRDSQRADGLIWDMHQKEGDRTSHWFMRFTPGNFATAPDQGLHWIRIPVEADVEYLYVQGIYDAWRASGDDAWMASMLDSAKKAVKYSTSDPLRWSSKYQLIKRGYTVDAWDFQSEEDTALTGDAMLIKKDVTRFGVMHGDNTGMIASLRMLGQMLDHAGRSAEAAAARAQADGMQERLNKLAWNGRFFTHQVPEDPTITRDFGGTETNTQLSLSNAYALNRGISHDQALAIIGEYEKIRAALPVGSPGEWYSIYPPFKKGFGAHGMWRYVNGGVITCVAGELARGAFENGREDYGVDILRRLARLGEAKGGYIPQTMVGSQDPPTPVTFQPLDISAVANRDICAASKRPDGVEAWTDNTDNDVCAFPVGKQIFKGVPFLVPEPAKNRHRVAIGLTRAAFNDPSVAPAKFLGTTTIPVGRKAGSLYFLHTVSNGKDGALGTVTFEYADGSSFVRPISAGREALPFWFPQQPLDVDREIEDRPYRTSSTVQLAWEGSNKKATRIGITLARIDNPKSDREIKQIVLSAAPSNGMKWLILGLATSDRPLDFSPSNTTGGMPNRWAGAAMVYGLVEGLAGVKDLGAAFNKVEVTPRWAAAGVENITTLIRYPASQGYLGYRYHHDRRGNTLGLEVTGTAADFPVKLLLPPGRVVKSAELDGAVVNAETLQVEKSTYAVTTAHGAGVHTLKVVLR